MANTSAPLSEVAVANMAAALLSDATITSLDDNTAVGRFMSREFGYTRDEVLQSYPWHFAIKRALLDPTADAPPWGWTYKFALPSDCVKLLPLRADGTINGDLVPFELESREILTDYSTNGSLRIRYIKRETVIARWSPLAARVLGARLAVLAAIRVSGKAVYHDKAKEAYQLALWEAQHADSLERGLPEEQFYDSALSVRGA